MYIYIHIYIYIYIYINQRLALSRLLRGPQEAVPRRRGAQGGVREGICIYIYIYIYIYICVYMKAFAHFGDLKKQLFVAEALKEEYEKVIYLLLYYYQA